MKFFSVNCSTNRMAKRKSGFPATSVSGLPTEMDVACECGHRWHAVRGNAKGEINNGARCEVQCPECSNVDAFNRHLSQSA